MVTNNACNEKTAASGKVLQGQGIGTTSDYSTATYPSTATGTGKILRADGTNWVATTATYPDTAGASANVLTSNGTNWTSAAPAASTAYTLYVSVLPSSPASSTTYYMYQQSNLTTNTAINYGGSFYIPIAGTLRKCYGTFQTGAASAGSAENSTFNIRVNDTTSVLVSNTVQLTGASSLISFSNASMSTSLSAGDFISFEWITPAWGTPPTSCGLNVTVLIS